MKYGDTLRERSVPDWLHYNIDYDQGKDLIKTNTIPGKGKAVSIPGQGDTVARGFGEEFFRYLKKEHQRINLFIKSKCGEIQSRLDHISRALAKPPTRRSTAAASPAQYRAIERYARIEADLRKVGNEVQSLARFRKVQRTGFIKLLKKYKKWTKDSELDYRFKMEVAEDPSSLFQLDLGALLDQYSNLLRTVRNPVQPKVARPSTSSSSTSTDASPEMTTSSRISKALEIGSEIDFDMALSSIPFGSHGSKAAYWIHPDNIIETHVELLRHMQLYKKSPSTRTSPVATPSRRQSSSLSNGTFSYSNEEDAGFLVLDNAENFGKRHNATTIGDAETGKGVYPTKAVGHVRWTLADEAAIALRLQSIGLAKLKRKRVSAFLNTSRPLDLRRQSTSSISSAVQEEQSKLELTEDAAAVREWLAEHEDISVIGGACTRRTRFTGVKNDSDKGLWATLDREITIKDSLLKTLEGNDWVANSQQDSTVFPYAVLEIRSEGTQSDALIKILDSSHLVERIPGFSLEAHVVWTCATSSTMSDPWWLSTMKKDIRKVPEAARRRRRQVNITSRPIATRFASTSSLSLTDGQTSQSTAPNADSSATSAPESVYAPPSRGCQEKPRRPIQEYIPHLQPEQLPQKNQGYWNEYDCPEDGDDEGYYITLDPDDTTAFPGFESLSILAQRIKGLFISNKPSEDEQRPIITPPGNGDMTDTDNEEGSFSYGTMSASPTNTSPPASRQGYFSSLFGGFKHPSSEYDAIQNLRQQPANQRETFLSVLAYRQHEREMTKLRLYSTCLFVSALLAVILGTLISTSRRKEIGVVDSVVLVGALCDLVLLIVAIISMMTRHEKLGVMHHAVVYFIVLTVVAFDVWLLNWVLS